MAQSCQSENYEKGVTPILDLVQRLLSSYLPMTNLDREELRTPSYCVRQTSCTLYPSNAYPLGVKLVAALKRRTTNHPRRIKLITWPPIDGTSYRTGEPRSICRTCVLSVSSSSWRRSDECKIEHTLPPKACSLGVKSSSWCCSAMSARWRGITRTAGLAFPKK